MPKPTRVPTPASANSCYLIEPATFPSLLGTSRVLVVETDLLWQASQYCEFTPKPATHERGDVEGAWKVSGGAPMLVVQLDGIAQLTKAIFRAKTIAL